jgi:probable F420-dependent oxidoreductase
MLIGVAQPPVVATGIDPIVIRDFAQAVEDMGFQHYCFAEHVVGRGQFHEAMSHLGYLAGITKRMELVTCMMLLPLRPAALVAKQAAHVDLLSGGRLRLGVSVSNFPQEYETLGVDFKSRGRKIEEQIAVMRALWTQEQVDFQGRFHQVHAAIGPRPGRMIPIWMGGGTQEDQIPSERVLRRVARLADGFIPLSSLPAERAPELVSRLHEAAHKESRDPATLGVDGDITLQDKTPDDWAREARIWRDAGAVHLILRQRQGPKEQIASLQRFKDEIGLE